MDSRKVTPGALFVCTPGMQTNPERWLEDAARAGAVAAATHTTEGTARATELGMFAIQLANDRAMFNRAVLEMAWMVHRDQLQRLRLVGVTGTNGKTTVSWLVRELLERLGERTGYIGTLGFECGALSRDGLNTTPFPCELVELLVLAESAGARNVAIEASSHGLAENRVMAGIFDVGVFTNLTQDHLDFHKTMAEYEQAKLRMFPEWPTRGPKTAVINVDDPVGARWARLDRFRAWSAPADKRKQLLRFGHGGELVASAIDVAVTRIAFDLTFLGETRRVEAPLGSRFNVENLTAAIGAVIGLGFPFDTIVEAARTVRPVPGRFEPVENDRGIEVLIDYAHTPDALEKLLDSVRGVARGRVITVFGCGGDRDKTKRPLMAAAASMRSDLTIVTSDNPRTEDPAEIISDTVAGIVHGREHIAILDRREAIFEAIRRAKTGDVVVIAGKGHENYQIIGRDKLSFSDRAVALEALRS